MKTIFASVNVLRLLTVSALLNDTTCCGLMIGISFGWKLLTQLGYVNISINVQLSPKLIFYFR